MALVTFVFVYIMVRCLARYYANRYRDKVAQRARERYLLKRTLERNGFTVIVDPFTGEIKSYFESRTSLEGGRTASDAG